MITHAKPGGSWTSYKNYFTVKLPFGFHVTLSRTVYGKGWGKLEGTWHDVKLDFGSEPQQPREGE